MDDRLSQFEESLKEIARQPAPVVRIPSQLESFLEQMRLRNQPLYEASARLREHFQLQNDSLRRISEASSRISDLFKSENDRIAQTLAGFGTPLGDLKLLTEKCSIELELPRSLLVDLPESDLKPLLESVTPLAQLQESERVPPPEPQCEPVEAEPSIAAQMADLLVEELEAERAAKESLRFKVCLVVDLPGAGQIFVEQFVVCEDGLTIEFHGINMAKESVEERVGALGFQHRFVTVEVRPASLRLV